MSILDSIKATSSDKLAPLALAFLFAAGYFAFLFVSMFHAVPAESRDLVNNLGQVLGSVVMLIVGYFFGSSASSKSKDATIDASIKAAAEK